MADVTASHVAYLSVGSNMGEKLESLPEGHRCHLKRSGTSKFTTSHDFIEPLRWTTRTRTGSSTQP
jgi:7,8-dihydro-6-hydroxymethylpterin-pyrophosphokinase